MHYGLDLTLTSLSCIVIYSKIHDNALVVSERGIGDRGCLNY